MCLERIQGDFLRQFFAVTICRELKNHHGFSGKKHRKQKPKTKPNQNKKNPKNLKLPK